MVPLSARTAIEILRELKPYLSNYFAGTMYVQLKITASATEIRFARISYTLNVIESIASAPALLPSDLDVAVGICATEMLGNLYEYPSFTDSSTARYECSKTCRSH